MKKLLRRFSVRDLLLVSAMAAAGIAVKPLVSTLAHIVSTPLMIPGGVLAGGLYMLWLVVAFGLTRRRGTAFLVGFVQALLVMLTGLPGSHGLLSLFSYTLPGAAIDLVFLLIRRKIDNMPLAFLAGLTANLAGTAAVNFIFFGLPLIPLLLSLSLAALSGGLGGILSWGLLSALGRFGVGPGAEEQSDTEG